jgi:sugar lactone lactonase YvrE
MISQLSRAFLAVVAAGAAIVPVAGPASAVAPPLGGARIAVHFDLAGGQMPENVAVEPGGALDVTFAAARQVARVDPSGATRILATLPKPADGGVRTPVLGFPLTTGVVRTPTGVLYVLYATGGADLTGLWRLTPGGTPRRIAALPADGLPNGLVLDQRRGRFLVTDSVLGRIWSVPLAGGGPAVWSAAGQLASTGFLGVNGAKLHGDALWVTNLDQGTLLRVPFRTGGGAGVPQVEATGLPGLDDFAFTGRGEEVLAAVNGPNEVVRIQPGGTTSTVLDGTDGLQNPTSIAVRGRDVYVLSAAYTTATDPNLLRARLSGRR